MGYEGGVRVIGFVTHLKENSTHRLLPQGMKYEGLMHASDWLPTLTAIADGVTHTQEDSSPVPPPEGNPSVATLRQLCDTQKKPESPRGHGLNQWCALVKNGKSPRTEAVLALDDVTNFVSYIKFPYKLMIGHIGSGEWSSEPTGTYIFDNATFFQKVEAWAQDFLDYHFESRDISFFWHEVLHLMSYRIQTRISGKIDFNAMGHCVLGSAESGDVMASKEIDPALIPIEVGIISHRYLLRMLIDVSFHPKWKGLSHFG